MSNNIFAGLYHKLFKKNEPKVVEENPYPGQVVSFSRNSSGDMLGGHKSIELKYSADQARGVVIYSNAECHNQDAKIEEYYVSKDIFNDITRIISEEKFYLAKDLPRSEFEVLDGATTSVTVRYDDRKSFSYNSNQELNDQVCDTCNKILALIKEATNQLERIPTIVYREAIEEKEGLQLHISDIEGCYVHYKVENNSSTPDVLANELIFLKGEKDQFQQYAKFELEEEKNIRNYIKYDFSIRVDKENFFETGRYKAILGDAEDIFEVK